MPLVDGMKIVIATPFYEMKGWSPYIKSLVTTVWFLTKHTPIEVEFWPLSGDSYVERARNTIANLFMESEHTHLIFIDSDMEWDIEGFTKLLAADVDVVGAGYPCKNTWDFYGVLPYGQRLEDGKDDGHVEVNEQGLIRAWGVPTGFMKIKKEVFKKLAEKEPENYYMIQNKDDKEPHKVFNFFGRIPPLGEDISFCRRWAGIGGDLWIEPRITLLHYGVKGWEGNYHEHLMKLPGGSKDPNRVTA